MQVNASGRFCGVAEMIGPVDFEKSVDYWNKDKWTGQFPVKWHIVKDVPSFRFRHIILENNDNKPVTNSRDTQEVYHDYSPLIIHLIETNIFLAKLRCLLNLLRGAKTKSSLCDLLLLQWMVYMHVHRCVFQISPWRHTWMLSFRLFFIIALHVLAFACFLGFFFLLQLSSSLFVLSFNSLFVCLGPTQI